MALEFIPSAKVIAALKRARLLLPEKGYQIFTPADNYRRTEFDFIFIPREFGYLFLIRAGVHGLEVRRRHKPIDWPNVIPWLREQVGSPVRQRHFMPYVDFDEWWQWIDPAEYDGFQEALRQSRRYWRSDETRSVRGRKK